MECSSTISPRMGSIAHPVFSLKIHRTPPPRETFFSLLVAHIYCGCRRAGKKRATATNTWGRRGSNTNYIVLVVRSHPPPSHPFVLFRPGLGKLLNQRVVAEGQFGSRRATYDY